MLDTIVCKVNENEITNSKHICKLRLVLRDPVAKEKFVQGENLDRVLEAVSSLDQPKKGSLAATSTS